MRIPVATIVEMVAEGPDLEREDIYEALKYAAEGYVRGNYPLCRMDRAVGGGNPEDFGRVQEDRSARTGVA